MTQTDTRPRTECAHDWVRLEGEDYMGAEYDQCALCGEKITVFDFEAA